MDANPRTPAADTAQDASGLLASEATDLWNAINYWSDCLPGSHKREAIGTRVNRIIRGAIDRERRDVAELVAFVREIANRFPGGEFEREDISRARALLSRLEAK